MKSLLLITDVPFWRSGTGNRERIARLVNFLEKTIAITVAYVGIGSDRDEEKLQQFEIRLEYLDRNIMLKTAEYGKKVAELAKAHQFDACIIEYVHNSYFLNYLPAGITTFLDMHDLLSDRIQGFSAFNRRDVFEDISPETEREIFSLYDYLICICEPDLLALQKYFDDNRLILAPHAPTFKKKTCRDKLTTIGYLASEYSPNVDGINKFLKESWPVLAKENEIRLKIGGNVGKYILPFEYADRVDIEGYIGNIEHFYELVDAAINPVEYGAGIKIKNVEALAHSLPMVTTPHGARGMEDGAGRAFLVAPDGQGFVEKITRLISNESFRKEISKTAYEYATDKFSPQRCYQLLADTIHNSG